MRPWTRFENAMTCKHMPTALRLIKLYMASQISKILCRMNLSRDIESQCPVKAGFSRLQIVMNTNWDQHRDKREQIWHHASKFNLCSTPALHMNFSCGLTVFSTSTRSRHSIGDV